MSGKKRVKPRQERKPRNWTVVNMIIGTKGGPFENKANKRRRQKADDWRNQDWGE